MRKLLFTTVWSNKILKRTKPSPLVLVHSWLTIQKPFQHEKERKLKKLATYRHLFCAKQSYVHLNKKITHINNFTYSTQKKNQARHVQIFSLVHL